MYSRFKATDAQRLRAEYNRLVEGLAQRGTLPQNDQMLANPALPDDILKEAVPGNIRRAEHFLAFLKRFVQYLKRRMGAQQVRLFSTKAEIIKTWSATFFLMHLHPKFRRGQWYAYSEKLLLCFFVCREQRLAVPLDDHSKLLQILRTPCICMQSDAIEIFKQHVREEIFCSLDSKGPQTCVDNTDLSAGIHSEFVSLLALLFAGRERRPPFVPGRPQQLGGHRRQNAQILLRPAAQPHADARDHGHRGVPPPDRKLRPAEYPC